MSDYDKQVFDEMVETRVSQLTDLLFPIIDELRAREDEPNVGAAAASAMCTAAAAFVAMCFAPDFGTGPLRETIINAMTQEIENRFLMATAKVAEITAMAVLDATNGPAFDPEMN